MGILTTDVTGPAAGPGPGCGQDGHGRGDDESRAAGRRPLDLGPASVYEAITRQMVERMADDLDEIKGRLNGLLFLVAGAVILDTLARLVA